jgi:hypothetical protein
MDRIIHREVGHRLFCKVQVIQAQPPVNTG